MALDHNFWTAEYPMVKIFDYDSDRKLIYDSKANFVFLISIDELTQLEVFLKNQESPAVSEELKSRFGNMLAAGLLVKGPWRLMFDASDEKINELIDYNARNILMRKFVLEITQDCNFRCTYCSNTLETEYRHHRKKHMSLATAKAGVDMYYKLYTDFLSKVPAKYRKAFVKQYAPTLGFYGGEPTLNWKVLTQTTDYWNSLPWEEHGIDKEKLSITVNTNLSYISEEMVRFLAANRAWLFASLDGPASEHDKCRVDVAGRPTFERAYRNLLKIKEYDPIFFENNVVVLAVESDEYDREKTHAFLDELGCKIDYLSMSRHDCFIHEPTRRLNIIKENREEFIENAREDYEKNPEIEKANYTFATSLRTDTPSQGDIANSLPTCPVGIDNIMVDIEGNLHVCHKTDGSFVLGDLESGLKREALQAFYRKLAALSNQSACRNCWAFRECGMCAASKLKGGEFVNPTQPECEYIRESAALTFESFIRIYRDHPDFMDKLKAYVEDPSEYKSVVDLNKIEWEKL